MVQLFCSCMVWLTCVQFQPCPPRQVASRPPANPNQPANQTTRKPANVQPTHTSQDAEAPNRRHRSRLRTESHKTHQWGEIGKNNLSDFSYINIVFVGFYGVLIIPKWLIKVPGHLSILFK